MNQQMERRDLNDCISRQDIAFCETMTDILVGRRPYSLVRCFFGDLYCACSHNAPLKLRRISVELSTLEHRYDTSGVLFHRENKR